MIASPSHSTRTSGGTRIVTFPMSSMRDVPAPKRALVRLMLMSPMTETARKRRGRIQSPARVCEDRNAVTPRAAGTISDGTIIWAAVGASGTPAAADPSGGWYGGWYGVVTIYRTG